MNEQITNIDNIKQFTDQCFDRDNDKSARIVKGILDAKSPRISDISKLHFWCLVILSWEMSELMSEAQS